MVIKFVCGWSTKGTISQILREHFILFFQRTIKEEDYVVVLFLSNCDKNDKCEETLTDLEDIDDQLEDIGILFFYTDDETYAAKLKVMQCDQICLKKNTYCLS
jgi:hypothetical protein